MDSRSRSRNRSWQRGSYVTNLTSYTPGNPVFGSHPDSVFTDKIESVESHRGKPRYIDAGDKRMKKYNPFYRRLEEFPVVGAVWEFFDLPYGVCWYEGHPVTWFVPSRDYSRTADQGKDMPPMHPDDVSALGENFRNFVIRDMYAKANAPRYNTARFLAELGETLVGIRQLLVGAVKVLLKADQSWKYVKHFSLNSEELWLWYRYALLPAMLDAEDMLKALEPPREVNRVQDGLRMKYDITGSNSAGPVFAWRGSSTKEYWKCNGKVTVGCGGAMDIVSKMDPSEWGTSAHDVLMGAAEVIPFGFVLNWFFNFEDWLASLRDANVIFAQSYATYSIDCVYEFTPTVGSILGKNPKMHIYQQERIVDVEPPSLPLIDKHWVNLLRTVDGITLTTGILKGILNKRRR